MKPVIFLLFCLVAFGGQAFAHAQLKRAEPAVGGTVASPPKTVALTFTEGVEPGFCSVSLVGPDDRPVETGKPHLAPADGNTLVVDLPALAPGRYRVDWHAVSVDSHKTRGSFTFVVAP